MSGTRTVGDTLAMDALYAHSIDWGVYGVSFYPSSGMGDTSYFFGNEMYASNGSDTVDTTSGYFSYYLGNGCYYMEYMNQDTYLTYYKYITASEDVTQLQVSQQSENWTYYLYQ